MIITRTPFRVSFAGGGSDLRDFYLHNGYGAVVSTAIKKYMYIVIHPYFHDKIRIKYSRTEDVDSVDEIQHPILRECMRKVRIEKGIEIASFADIPAGTGLGSSSSFTVGLLNALYAYKGQILSKEQIAHQACEIEIDILKEPIGKQDQYAAAYGNINYIKFNKDDSVNVTPILITDSLKKTLQRNLCLYYIGGNRNTRDILSEQKQNLKQESKIKNLQKMLILADEIKIALQKNKPQHIGQLLHKGWIYKKELASGISNNIVDEMYNSALSHGAKGGKLLGAGGNGFLLIYSNSHQKLKKQLGCTTLPFEIDTEGSKIIFYE
ncbi:MAG: GHMP kinase [Nitrospirae bacterium]|nr:GHMP kinase [Nitrospirota bacterium]